MVQENSPLLPQNGGESSVYYFENRRPGSTSSVRDSDGAEVTNGLPAGTSEEEFAPRVLGAKVRQ
jgi:hypothetical protein